MKTAQIPLHTNLKNECTAYVCIPVPDLFYSVDCTLLLQQRLENSAAKHRNRHKAYKWSTTQHSKLHTPDEHLGARASCSSRRVTQKTRVEMHHVLRNHARIVHRNVRGLHVCVSQFDSRCGCATSNCRRASRMAYCVFVTSFFSCPPANIQFKYIALSPPSCNNSLIYLSRFYLIESLVRNTFLVNVGVCWPTPPREEGGYCVPF